MQNIYKLSLVLFFGFFASNLIIANTSISTKYLIQGDVLTINKKLTIQELFDLISDRTPYDFFFNSSLKELNTTIKMAVTNASVKQVLDKALHGLGIEYSIKDSVILIRAKSNQNGKRTIKGTVKDDQDVPLPGVNVTIQNTNKGRPPILMVILI